jgi:uncharacterized coiled-coil protein SlyX
MADAVGEVNERLAEMQRQGRRIARLSRELTQAMAAFKAAAADVGIDVEFDPHTAQRSAQ